MALEITVGPPRLAINQGYGVLISDQDGQIPWPTDKGFYHADTRILSAWYIFADGEPWDFLNSGNITHYASRIFLKNQKIITREGVVPPGTLALSISRSIGGGIHEDLDITNHGMGKVSFNLEIVARSEDRVIQGVAHRRLPVHGVQFHPESVLSEHGDALIRNFLAVARAAAAD